MLTLIVGIIDIIGVSLILVFYNEILDFFTNLVDSIRLFLWDNKTLVDMAFLILYAFLQLMFILKLTQKNVNTGLVVTIFVLSLLTLMGIERLCMKSRYNYLHTQASDLLRLYSLNEADYKKSLDRERELIRRYKDLKKENDELKES